MGLPRDARSGGGLRPPLEHADRDRDRPVHRLAGHRDEQVLRLARALRPDVPPSAASILIRST